MSNYIRSLEVIVLFLLIFIPSLRGIVKYLPFSGLICVIYALLVSIFCYFAVYKVNFFRSIYEYIDQKWILFIFVAIYIIVNFFIYPIADIRKEFGMGSTADDAFIETVRQFMSNGRLYDVVLYDGTPISPGPAWILINSPFVLLNCYILKTPSYILISILTYWYYFNNKYITLNLLVLLSVSLIFWELMVTGHDLISIGFSFSIIILLVYNYIIDRDCDSFVIHHFLLALFIGVVSTSRIVFMCLPVLVLILTIKRNLKLSLYIFFISMFSAIMFHLVFYFTSEYYQPLHLLGRGSRNVSLVIITFGILLTSVLSIIAVFKVNDRLSNIFLWFFILIVIPLSLISFGEFLSIGKDLAAWEGANYLVPALPVYLFYIAEKYAVNLRHCEKNV